jgi:hypothetical protein
MKQAGEAWTRGDGNLQGMNDGGLILADGLIILNHMRKSPTEDIFVEDLLELPLTRHPRWR